MSVPKKRKSLSKTKRGRANAAIKPVELSTCSKCKKPVKPHHACVFCGTYKGKEAIKIRVSKEEKILAKKAKVKELKKEAKKQEKKGKK